ncbi:unnamed protein product, partial [marine sediment metagenome]
QMVESYRKAVGLDYKEVPPELLAADKKRLELRSALSQARARKAPEDELSQLQAQLELAETQLELLKVGYGL